MVRMGGMSWETLFETLGAHRVHEKIPSPLPFFQNGEGLVVTPYLMSSLAQSSFESLSQPKPGKIIMRDT